MKKISVFFVDSKPFSQLVGLCLLLLFGFLMVVGMQILQPMSQSPAPGAIRFNLMWQGCSQLLIFFVPALLFAWLYQRRPAEYLGLDLQGRKWLLALVGVVVMLLLVPINDWLTYWNEQWQMGSVEEVLRRQSQQSKELTQQMLSLTSPGDLCLQLLVVALLPAVCEEFFFRGCLQQVLQRWFGNRHVAVVVTAVIFSLAHGDVYGFVPRLVLGLLLGYLFVFSGSMLVNAFVHFFNNAMVVVMFYLNHRELVLIDPTEPMFFSWTTTIICGLAGLLLFLVYFTEIFKKPRPKTQR